MGDLKERAVEAKQKQDDAHALWTSREIASAKSNFQSFLKNRLGVEVAADSIEMVILNYLRFYEASVDDIAFRYQESTKNTWASAFSCPRCCALTWHRCDNLERLGSIINDGPLLCEKCATPKHQPPPPRDGAEIISNPVQAAKDLLPKVLNDMGLGEYEAVQLALKAELVNQLTGLAYEIQAIRSQR